MEIDRQRWDFVCSYLLDVFGTQDDHLASIRERAVAAGLPDIAVSPDVGRMLMMLVSMTDGRRALELGTLAGYSAIWIARGLRSDGTLITVEAEDRHADFALTEIQRAGVGDRVEILRGKALDVLPDLATRLGPQSLDVVFLDAVKHEYPDYFRIVRPLVRPGGLVIADNALSAGYWMGDGPGSSPDRDGMDRFNRMIAGDPEFEAVCVPLRQGVVIGRRNSDS